MAMVWSVRNEQELVDALIEALEAPVASLFGDADYEVFDGDIKRWLSQGNFSTLESHKLQEISECFVKLAKIRRDKPLSEK
jgi:hypothetical protein